MRKKMLSIAILSVLMLAIPGCGKIRYPSYYTLTMAPELKPASSTHPPVTIAVQQFQTPAYIRQGRIVYSQAPGNIGFYEYHRWAVDPGAAVTSAVVQALQGEPLFSSATRYDGHQSVDYLMSGRLEKLEEVDYGGGVTVEAKLSAEVMNVRTGSIVWTGDATETSKVEGHDVNAVVAGMSRALQSSIDRLLTGMQQRVSGT